MNTQTFEVSSPFHDSFRVRQIAGMFDVPLQEKLTERFTAELPSADKSWQVGLIVGPSGAGKSTLMRSLQSVARFPLVVLDEPEQIGIVQPGYLIWRDSAPALHRGYLAAIAALAGAGNHVTLSAAGHTYDEIVKAFSGIQVIGVGMRCDFDVLVDREQRTGRWAGVAAQSLDIHDGWAYDLEIDTTNGPDPLELARRVLLLVTP